MKIDTKDCPDLIDKKYCKNDFRGSNLCSKNHNCKFKLEKELKQLRQENKELKEMNGMDVINDFAHEAMELRYKNEQLEERISSQQQENIELNGQLIDAEEKLDEITKIIEEDTNSCFYDTYECEDCDRNHFCLYYTISEILEEEDD